MKLQDIKVGDKIEVILSRLAGLQGEVTEVPSGPNNDLVCANLRNAADVMFSALLIPASLKIVGSKTKVPSTLRGECIQVAREVREAAKWLRSCALNEWKDNKVRRDTALEDAKDMRKVAQALAQGNFRETFRLYMKMDTGPREEMPQSLFDLVSKNLG